MKKLFLMSALALFGLMNAQEKGNFKAGVHIGLPVGDFSETHSFNFGVDVAYLYPLAQNFKLGVTTGYSHYFGEDFSFTLPLIGEFSEKASDLGIIPVAATAQFNLGSNVFVGADLGYAFFTGDYSSARTGAFYYQPKVGYSVSGKHDLFFSFKGMIVRKEKTVIGDSGNSLNSLSLGYAYNF